VPSFEDSALAQVAPEEVWKILYDPSRFPEWWVGIETVETAGSEGSELTNYTVYPTGYADFPMAQRLETTAAEQRVRISCLVSDLRFDWLLEPAGDATRISVQVEIPDREAHRLDTQRATISESLLKLAALAESGR
jgi:hypothetical protein